MDDSLVLDIPMVAGHAAATIASLTGDTFGPEPVRVRRTRQTAALAFPPDMEPVARVADGESIDEILDLSVLMPFDVDWDAMATDAPAAKPVVETVEKPRRISRFEKQRIELEERMAEVRSRMKDVRLRVSMLGPDQGSST